MSNAFSIQGATSGNIAEVNSNNQLQVNQPLTSTQAGFITSEVEIDPGTDIGYRVVRSLKCSDEFRLINGMVTQIFDYQFTAPQQDTNFWKYTASTMTASQSGGFVILNSNATTTTTTGVSMQTWRYFKLMSNAQLYIEMKINLTAYPLANQIAEFGLFVATQTTAPADGIYFRLNTNGLFGVLNNSGTETLTGPLFNNLVVGTSYSLTINMTQYRAEFWIGGLGGTLAAIINVPPGNIQPFASAALPMSIQQRNSGVVGAVASNTPQMQLKVGSVRINQDDLMLGMPLSHIQGAYGLAYQTAPGQITSTTFQGSISSYVVQTAPTPTVLSNTSANINSNFSLGGLAANTVTFALNNDGIIFAYQNPAGGISEISRTLVITGITIQSVVTTVMAATASSFMYSVSFGGTAIALTTAQTASFITATAKSFKILPLGIETYAASAAVGTLGTPSPIVADFTQSPIVINPGEWIEIISRCLVGPPASGAITVTCGIKHYFI